MVRLERPHLFFKCNFGILSFFDVKMFSGDSANPVVTTRGESSGLERASQQGRKETEAAAFNYQRTLASCDLRGGSAAGHCIRRGLNKGDVPSARAA